MAVGREGYCGLVGVEGARVAAAAAAGPAFVRRCGGAGHAAVRLLREAGAPVPAALENAGWRGTPYLTRQRRPRAHGALLLVGDAAGYAEPFSGEGMAWALESGTAATGVALEALAGVERADVDRRWNRFHRRRIGRRHRRSRWIARALRHPRPVAAGVRLLRRWPGLGAMIARGVGAP